MSDRELLQAFAQERDEAAFRQLVDRYIDLVYSSARRQINDPHLAEDVTQAVFMILARKAGSLAAETLGGSLVRTARYTALAALRQEKSLKHREQAVAAATERAGTRDLGDPWEQISPLLDEAIARLGAIDRAAVVLRYLQGKTYAEVAAVIGASEQAATKRVARAVDKLRDYFARRGVTVASAMVGATILQHAIHPAPSGLAAAATAEATSSAGTQNALSASLAEEALRLMSSSARPVLIASAVALVLILMLVAGLATRRDASATIPTPAAATLNATRPITPAAAPVRVGYYLSHRSAVSIDRTTGQPYGYSTRLLQDLGDRSFEVIPVIEPGTQQLDELPLLLATSFKGKRPVNVTDAADLRTLDVLVAGAPAVPDESLTAIESAVSSGMGLMIRSLFAVDEPGFTPIVERLYDLKGASRCGGNVAVESEVLLEHPILSSRTGKPGQLVRMRPIGAYGPLGSGSTGLIRVVDPSQMKPFPANGAVHTVYVHTLGEGRIVCCCFTTYDLPKNIAESVGPQFAIRAVKWLAKRAAE